MKTPSESSGAAEAPVVDGYLLELVPGPDRRKLIVVTSARNFFALRKRYGCDALYLADLGTGYFITSPTRIAAAIADFVDAGGYERLLFVGSSKAGFAVLMLAGLCARARPRLAVRALSLNPVTQLFPDDPVIPYPSYRKLQRRAEVNDALARRLRRFGDLSHLAWLPNFYAIVTYPSRNPIDCVQAGRVTGPNFRHYPVDSVLHGTMIFFAWSGVSEATALKRLEKLFGGGDDDRDLAATRPEDLAVVAKAIAASRLPSFEQLVDEAMAAEPPPRTVVQRLQRAATLRLVLARRSLRGLRHALARRFSRAGSGPQPSRPKLETTGRSRASEPG